MYKISSHISDISSRMFEVKHTCRLRPMYQKSLISSCTEEQKNKHMNCGALYQFISLQIRG